MIDPRIARMIEETRQQASLTPASTRDLREAIESSPFLSDLMVKAIEADSLRKITFDPPSNEGGHYDAKLRSISVNANIVDRPRRNERIDQLTSILGHETGHAMMARSTELSAYRLSYELDQAIKQAAEYGDPTVDVTATAAIFIAASRRNEGFAELTGMNALASRVAHTTPDAELGDVLLRLDPTTPCVTDGRAAQGIQFDANFMQRTGGTASSPAVQAVAACQFDKSGSTLGQSGSSDYNAYYLTYVVSTGAELLQNRSQVSSQSVPQLGLNMDALGSSAAEIERAGVPLGGPGRVFGLIDTSASKNVPVEIRQIGAPHAQSPAISSEVPAAYPMLVDNAAHPDHQDYRKIHDWVKATGNWNEVESRNVSAALFREQLENPTIRQLDQVTGGVGKDGAHNVFAVYAPFGDAGPQFHSHVDGKVASQQPAAQNLQHAEEVRQSNHLKLTQDQTQQQEQTTAATRHMN